MTKQQKKEIKNILNNEDFNINEKIEYIAKTDTSKTLKIWDSIYDNEDFIKKIKESGDIWDIKQMVKNIPLKDSNSDFLYFNGKYWFTAHQKKEEIIKLVKEEINKND